ncbi:expressed unknown protein [Seminavis robusta]|uniref:Uncharacterized protein n=1 Tax=Seminavis robusta TaxID=568900 RepID=A0A9N8DDX2_9STRA|nr:expressed unknown protein [Seminavis robusta]|eukprot:Sro102_g052180.1 n/a (352) ;mRNA; r:91670-92725
MPRNKSTPKRRRIDEEEEEKQALEALKKAPTEVVEEAAAEAFAQAVQEWPPVKEDEVPPEWLQGLGFATTVPEQHLEALKRLHSTIQEKASGNWSSWSGDPKDPRRRAFGILPDTLGATVRDQLDISTPWKQPAANDKTDDERAKNRQATVTLSEMEGVKDAIAWLCQTMTSSVVYTSLQPHLTYSSLIAAQPNLHNGRTLLPIHVDHPLKDGFGIIIVTIAMVGDGTILFQDCAGKRMAKMQLAQGQAYMISGTARDACAHGVLADNPQRESLNLRFGLHDWKRDDNTGETMIPSKNVLQFWEVSRDGNATVEPKGSSGGDKKIAAKTGDEKEVGAEGNGRAKEEAPAKS